jgi:hypothetical protein
MSLPGPSRPVRVEPVTTPGESPVPRRAPSVAAINGVLFATGPNPWSLAATVLLLALGVIALRRR